MYKIILSIFFFTSLGQATSGPNFQAPLCIKEPNNTQEEIQKIRLAIEVYKATKRKYTDSEGLWDQLYLQNNPHIVKALDEFSQGKRGRSVASLHPKEKTAQALHNELIRKGFTYKTVPLVVDHSPHQKKYWKITGEQTTNKEDPEVVKMHIYTHPDGGMVRIKASGHPDKAAKYSKRVAHVVMSVLINFDPADCQGEVCSYDTSYDNEAFKIIEGTAGPKAPSPRYGFKQFIKNNTPKCEKLNRIAEDIYADLIHTPLKTDCPNSYE
jgi:hypothetical protein